MPNDLVIEFTDILQGVIWVPLAMHFAGLTKKSLLRRKAGGGIIYS
jgi:hypothetical protein